MHQSFIGIDLGTTFLKGAVIDLDARQLSHTERMRFPSFVSGLPPAWREVDPQALVDTVHDLVHQLLPHAVNCSGLVMCSQMHGLVLTRPTGMPLSNAITWQDQRMEQPHPSGRGSYFDIMSEQVSDTERLAVGNDLLVSRPLGFLWWLKEHQALPFDLQVIPASLPDFVLASLCHSEPRVEPTNAAAYGAYDLIKASWRSELIERLGLGSLMWPHICDASEVVSTLNMDGQSLPCYAPVGDHQCAVLGTLLGPDELSINVSTGSQVGMLTHEWVPSLEYQTRPYFDHQYLRAIIHIPAGRSLNALLRLLTELAEQQGVAVPDPWSYISRVTSALDDTDLRVNLAFFPSSCGDAGNIEHIREETLSVAHLFTAAFNNMAENYEACARRIWPQCAWQRIVFSGGLVQKLPSLQRAISRVMPGPYRFPPGAEDTLMGLMILALHHSGRARSLDEAISLVQEP